MTGPTARPGPGPDDLFAASPRDQFTRIGGVSRTLMIPLLARHLASSRPDPIITDPAATALLGELGLSHLAGDWSFRAVEVGTAVRTRLLDTAVRDFAATHPGATIVTLGAGLCTRCIRLADLDVTWVDVDLPPVAALRRTLLPPGPNRTIIAGSVLARGWRDTIAGIPGPQLLVLEGLTMYLHEAGIRELLTDLADRSPGSELLIETTGPRTGPPGRYQYLRDKRTTGTEFTWGVRQHQELCRWHPQLELVRTWHVMDHHSTSWPMLIRALRHLPSVRAQSKIGHFRIASAQSRKQDAGTARTR
jgi:O-methyltransferase involved in polyketide biosynthesis